MFRGDDFQPVDYRGGTAILKARVDEELFMKAIATAGLAAS